MTQNKTLDAIRDEIAAVYANIGPRTDLIFQRGWDLCRKEIEYRQAKKDSAVQVRVMHLLKRLGNDLGYIHSHAVRDIEDALK